MRVLVITLGATALQKFDAASGTMQLRLAPHELLAQAAVEGWDTELLEMPVRSGAELTLTTVAGIRDTVLSSLNGSSTFQAFVLLIGTDTLEEAAFLLHLMLGAALRQAGATLAITGAMLPADQLGSDNVKNLRDALKVASSAATRQLGAGALVVMNDDIHLPLYVRKADSQLIGSFRSQPGSIGQLRSGEPCFYYSPPPPQPWLPAPEAAYEAVPAAALERQRVAIWTLTASASLVPESLLAELDGLVLAGSGTGSVPQAIIGQLSPAWTARLPIVICSRCGVGRNCDDWLYRGSRQKYESRGFVVGGAYEHLNPLQARSLLVLRLAAVGRA